MKGSIAYWGGFSLVATLGVYIQGIKEDGRISWTANLIKQHFTVKPYLSLLGNITVFGPAITAVKSGNWSDPSGLATP